MLVAWMMSGPALAEGPSLVTSRGALVLEHVSVDAEVQAGLAVVRVEQRFHNPFEVPVDATYLFPLPPDAAVRAMEMTCGGRHIVGELRTRDEARAIYDLAASQGKQAALLEQERPNLFRQSVSALCPGDEVVVELEYAEPLTLHDGRRELVFPTTVGPRYRPEGVPEPPFTTLPPHTVDISVSIDEGLPVASVWSDTHEIDIDEFPVRAEVRSAPGDDWPNKDFHVGWSYGAAAPRLGTVVVPPTAEEDGYISVTIEPATTSRAVPQQRELLFVIDESCSMSGEPFAAAAATVRLAMRQMRWGDTFNLVRFSSEASSLFSTPQPVTPGNVAAAEEWLGVFDGQGTEMTRGIVHSLDMPGDPERLRLVLLLTDGYIGNEDEVLATVDAHLGRSRLFSLGIGASVNRYLLDALAARGRGAVAYQLPDTPIHETVADFYARIDAPAWTDLAVRWSGIEITEMVPERIPDLFAGQPVQIVARYRSATAQASVTLDGTMGRTPYFLSRPLDLGSAEQHEALPVAWARRKIDQLTLRHHDDGDRLAREVTAVAMRHHLVTDYTSLVAVASGPSRCGAAVAEVEAPSMAPQGYDVPANGLPTSPSLSNGIGGLIGSSGTQLGSGGLGARGGGLGGGGQAEGLGGLGSLGTRSSGASGYGSGGGDFGSARGTGGGAVAGDPIILGSLDRTLIDEVVKRHLSQIRYCYQRELTKAPALAGKITIKFTIAKDGTVSAASTKSTTLNSPAVENCIVSRFLRMQFPAQGGGVVIVSYPFVFSPT